MDSQWLPALVLIVAALVIYAIVYALPTPTGTCPLMLKDAPGPSTSEPSPQVSTGPIRLEEPKSYTTARQEMVEQQLAGRDITDGRVLGVMGDVQRHEFVPDAQKGSAYADNPLPIGEGQTISQPYIVALMTQVLNLSGGEKVLEIGTGSGYQAAVLAEMVDEVYTIEIIGVLAERAQGTLDRLGYDNVQVKNADGYYGWEEHAPFDAIIVTAAASHVPPPLIDQLKDGGVLVIPLGSVRYHQTLNLVTKKGDEVETEYILGVRFVPMTGKVQEE